MNRSQALMLLSECTGDDIWSLEYCHNSRIPTQWIRELRDAYESGFQSNSQTIYFRDRIVSQFEGVRDVDLACKIGELLGVNVARIVTMHQSRSDVVRAIRESLEED